ncbi:hypothetical protein [Gimibacter soli]|uniref:Uncharacterized protein n=1 Tax=Gimibacter soli TaxID=3024400 RepID=A0AAF0BLE5_9PROT|nr:hypothetical protein [Gimibacter soli]WCL54062.1 hypothetical protein PH603_16105 [Gimibacter soli]
MPEIGKSHPDNNVSKIDMDRARGRLLSMILMFTISFIVLCVRTISLSIGDVFDPVERISSGSSSGTEKVYIAFVIFVFCTLALFIPTEVRKRSAVPKIKNVDLATHFSGELRARLNVNKRNILIIFITVLAANFSTQKQEGQLVMQFGAYALPATFFYFGFSLSSFWLSVTHNHVTGQLQDIFGVDGTKASLEKTFGNKISAAIDYWIPNLVGIVSVIISGVLVMAS